MALMLPNSVFFHVPKTGGNWVRSALRAGGISVNECIALPALLVLTGQVQASSQLTYQYVLNRMQHATYTEVETQGKFTFAFVRHPVSFYMSYWSYKTQKGWNMNDPFEASLATATCTEFAERSLNRYPGWYTGMCKRYYGDDFSALDFVGKQEQLADDLVRALHMAGERFDETALRAVAPVNSTVLHPEWKKRSSLSETLMSHILEAEHELAAAFGYVALHRV